MKTIKLCLLFLLIPFSSFGQGNCTNEQIQIYIELWAINSNGAGNNSLQISSPSGAEFLAVNFGGSPD